MIDMNYQDVLAAVRQVAADAKHGGSWSSYALPDAVAIVTGVREQYHRPSTTTEYDAVQRFSRQVIRAANALAAEGTLVKYGRGEMTPGGHRLGNEAMFYTLAAHQAAVAEADVRAGAAREEARRWAAVYDELTARGAEFVPEHWQADKSLIRGRTLCLTLAGFEKLLLGG
jgi:hypothetical protein